MKDMSKQSELGTIKEIAAEYGLSLSQFRSLKKEGKLNREELDLLQDQANS